MVTKEELQGLLDSLPESRLEEVYDLMLVLLQKPEELTETKRRSSEKEKQR